MTTIAGTAGLNRRDMLIAGTTLASASALGAVASTQMAQAQAPPTASGRRPNILFIMGDDVGWFNISAYHQGMMSGRTPNLDKLASQGMRFTDYYAEASCTAGRANFITGQNSSPHRVDDRCPGWCRCWHSGSGPHARHRLKGPSLRHRAVW